jgi:cobalt-zinc-cadmium efflux system membrane fusion protein
MAMVAVDRLDFVFVRRPGPGLVFERRPILTIREGNDLVVVAEPSKDHAGLKPGEEVATSGSLILEQMFEDRSTTHPPIRSTKNDVDDKAVVFSTGPE